MELLGGLALGGYFLSTNDTLPNNEVIPNKTKGKPEKNNDNIYNSNNKWRTRRIVDNLASDRFKKAKHPERTHVIPAFYNERKNKQPLKFNLDSDNASDSEFSENFDGSISNNSFSDKEKSLDLNDPTAFVKACDNISNNKSYEKKYIENSRNEKNNFLTQFDDLTFDNNGGPSSYNSMSQKIGDTGNISRMEIERKLALTGGYSGFTEDADMTYGIVDKNNFTHNNMKPHFSGKTYGFNPLQDEKRHEVNQRMVEQFSGSVNNLEYKPNTERKPLFDPTVGLTNMYGTPAMTDYFESRYIPGLERRNELPFQQTKVTPGLALGYNEIGKQGYTDSYRVLPKTVDELRTVSNPKISYGGVVIEGMKGKKGPVPSKMFKRRPLTFKENKQEDVLKGRSYLTAPSIYGKTNPKDLATVNRGAKATPYYGGAKLYTDLAKPDSLHEKFRASEKQVFKHAEPRNAQRSEAKEARGHDESYTPRVTQREKTQSYIGPAGVERTEKTYAFDDVNAISDPTNRDIYNSKRIGIVGNKEMDKTYAFDSINSIPDPTNRNLYNSKRIGGAGNAELDHTYAFDSINAIQDPTRRDIYNSKRIGGVTNAEFDKTYVHDDVNSIPDPTKRDIYNSKRIGAVNNAEFDKTYVHDDVNSIPDPTRRDIYNSKRIGGVSNAEFDKTYVHDDINSIPDPTKRDIYNSKRIGAIGNAEFDKTYVHDDINSIPDPTKRDIYNSKRIGAIGNRELDKSYVHDEVNSIPDPTKRDIYNSKRIGGAGNRELDKSYVHDEVNSIPDPTKRDIYNSKRIGGAGNRELDKSYVHDEVNSIPDPTRRDLYNSKRIGGAGNKELDKAYVHDEINSIPDPTKRDLYNSKRIGGAGNRELDKAYVHDEINSIPDPTRRDLYNSKRIGGAGNKELDKAYVHDEINAIPDPTRRDLYNSKRIGGAGNKELEKTYAFDDVNAIPDPTRRDLYNSKRIGGAGNKELEKTYAFDDVNAIPDPTRRDMYNSSRSGGGVGNSQFENQRGRGDANNMRVNIEKEVIAQGRSPTTSNYDKGPIIDYTVVRLNIPIQVNREVYPDVKESNDRLERILTKTHVPLPQQSWHFNSFPDENLKGNPYVNNVVHQAPIH
jgi:hypothetical protein